MPKLGINIDHIATLRQARLESDPDPIAAIRICEKAGADSIVAHLREDRRHIQDKDIYKLRQIATTRFNLEMSLNSEVVAVALDVKPDQATLVPERRQEVTTEGGLDVIRQFRRVKKVVDELSRKNIVVSLFIAPSLKQIQKAKQAGVPMIELHTGAYARAKNTSTRHNELIKIKEAARCAQDLGLIVNAGHGLNYENTKIIARISGMEELNIGHSIISRAVFVGLERAVREMVQLIQ